MGTYNLWVPTHIIAGDHNSKKDAESILAIISFEKLKHFRYYFWWIVTINGYLKGN